MRQSPQESRIMELMAPGVLCREGFLGHDRRPLVGILDADRLAVAALGLSHEELAGLLQEVLSAAMDALGRTVEAGRGLTAVYREAMGRIPCPFGHGGMFPKGQVELSDAISGMNILFTPLSVHLIGAHGFYQGLGARYRIEPADIAEILKPGRTRL